MEYYAQEMVQRATSGPRDFDFVKMDLGGAAEGLESSDVLTEHQKSTFEDFDSLEIVGFEGVDREVNRDVEDR